MYNHADMLHHRLEPGLLSPWPWIVTALLGATALYFLPDHRRAVLTAALLTLAVFLAWLILAIERRKHGRPTLSLEAIDQLDGFAFERWVIAMLEADGHRCVNVRDRGDFGVDLVAHIDAVPVGFQTKRYAGNVGNAAVQQVLAGCDYYGCAVAAVVTQSYFTAAAREQAAHGRYPVILVDRDGLMAFGETVREAVRAISQP